MKYTPVDWRISNSTNLCASDRVRGGAELMRLDALRLCREVDDKAKKTQGKYDVIKPTILVHK